VTSTGWEDPTRQPAGTTVVEYSVTAVDASGNRSVPATVTVELPGADQSHTLVSVAIGLLVLAGVLTAGYLLYRWRVARGTRLPHTAQPSRGEPPTRTPVP
jgi:hypothetical protein